MDDDEKNELPEMDTDKDTEKKARRSSILKPQKPRNPLSTLDFSEANPDCTLSKATRRVSFASSNFVKPFAADPEKNTIWDNTYEEEVSHTDSTKSNDQTDETKVSDLLNVTSIYSATDEVCHTESKPYSANSRSESNAPLDNIHLTNPGESLVTLARKLRSRSQQNSVADAMDFTLINSTHHLEKLDTAELVDVNKVCSATKLTENTMEFTTCITDKENVNPLINDLSLLVPKEYGSCSSNKTKYFTEDDLDFTKPLNETDKTIYFNKSENLNFVEVTIPSEIKNSDNIMEFTCMLSEDKNSTSLIRDSKKEGNRIVPEKLSVTNEIDVSMRTVCFDNSVKTMELTNIVGNDHMQYKVEAVTSQSRRKTIIFNETNGDMDLTVMNFNTNLETKENNEDNMCHTQELKKCKAKSRNKTIIFNQSENNMEFTTTLPVKILSNANHQSNQNIPITWKKEETIRFNDSGEEMDITNTSLLKETLEGVAPTALKRTICFEKSQGDMDCTTTLVGKIHDDANDDMKLAGVSSGNIISPTEKKVAVNLNKTGFECDTDLCSSLLVNTNKLKQCRDMSLTQNLHTESLRSNTNKQELKDCNSDLGHNINVSIGCTNPYKTIGNSSFAEENRKTTFVTTSDANTQSTSKSPFTMKNIEQNNFTGNVMDQEGGVVNDISNVDVGKSINDIKRHITDCMGSDAIKKRRIQESSQNEKSGLENALLSDSDACKQSDAHIDTNKTYCLTTSKANENGTNVISNIIQPVINADQKTDLKTSILSSSNVLYSEPMKMNVKTVVPPPDMLAHLNLEGTLNSDHVLTPATSFHINFSMMSPCIEDTQQLIHATFSKPETIKILSTGKGDESTGNVLCKGDNTFTEQKTLDDAVKINEKTYVKEDVLNTVENIKLHQEPVENADADIIKISNVSLKDDKSCILDDLTPVALVAEEFDHSASDVSSSESSPNKQEKRKAAGEDDSININNSDLVNYTLRSQMVLDNIKDNLLVYEPAPAPSTLLVSKLAKEFKDNCQIIRDLMSEPRKQILDLEERYNQDKESFTDVHDAVASSEENPGASTSLGLMVPKSLCERVCEIAKRTKKYWEFVKMQDDHFYFYTLFGTLPFKVHVHPELGIVYSVETFSNLSDISQPLCWYQHRLLQQKLKQENLLSVLGAKFDIFTLLDYVYMSMEEIINFHREYTSLVKKYGESHHFRMNPDFSITFEVINLKIIILWIITVKLSLSGLVSVTKEDITAVHKVGKIVNQEHIRTIAENTPKGPNFLRNFVENVDEYVYRIGKRIKK